MSKMKVLCDITFGVWAMHFIFFFQKTLSMTIYNFYKSLTWCIIKKSSFKVQVGYFRSTKDINVAHFPCFHFDIMLFDYIFVIFSSYLLHLLYTASHIKYSHTDDYIELNKIFNLVYSCNIDTKWWPLGLFYKEIV